ncbi:hypothetical protein DNU06_17280, partial [Putridiphycobacter roseus]
IVETNLGCTDTAAQTITIHPSPVVDLSINGNCLNEGTILADLTTIAGSSSIDSIHWQFGDNTFGNDSIENHNYNATGTYSVQLFAQSDQGCADSLVQTVFVNPNPLADFSIADTCVFQSINLNNNSNIASGTITSYEWDFGDNSNSNLFEPNHPFNQAGVYNVQLVAISDSACTDTSNLSLTIHPQPLSDFTFTSSCFNASFIDASNIASGSINDYAWDFGDMNTASIQNPNYIYTANGNYTVSLQTISDFGCVHDTSKNINIFNNFTADFVLSNSQICSGDCIQFSDSSTVHTSGTYTWAFSDGQTSNLKNPLVCFQNSGEIPLGIDVQYKVETHSGCVDSITYTNYIQVYPRPTAYFTYTPEDPSISNPYLVFQNQSTNAGSFTWNFGDNETSAVVSPSHVYPEIAKEYSVVLTAYDQSANCHDTYQTTISIADEILFFIPNAFSPNSGSINNTFQPEFTSGVDIYNFRMQLFNRWGEIVFETQDPSIGWDGQYQNQFVAQAAYVWKIDFTETMSDKKHTYSGYVTLVR